MGLAIYFYIIFYFILFLDFGQSNPIQEGEPEDHLTRPEVEYKDDIEEVTYSYNDHNGDNDHITSDHRDSEDETSSEVDSLQLDDQLTTENELFNDNESYDERTTSRMLDVLSRGLLKMHRKSKPDLDYGPDFEIEDRIVRYAMNNKREEI